MFLQELTRKLMDGPLIHDKPGRYRRVDPETSRALATMEARRRAQFWAFFVTLLVFAALLVGASAFVNFPVWLVFLVTGPLIAARAARVAAACIRSPSRDTGGDDEPDPDAD